MGKIKCWNCTYLDYDCMAHEYEPPSDGTHFCGQHGMACVDPDGKQVNLDSHGGCGYYPKFIPKQLTFDF